MKIDRKSLGIRFLIPLLALILVITLSLLLLVNRVTNHIRDDYQRFTVQAASSNVTMILDMAAADLTTAKLTGNAFVVEAKKQSVLEAIRISWSRGNQDGIITAADTTVLLSTLDPEATRQILAHRSNDIFSLEADNLHFLGASKFFPLWGWDITTIAKHATSMHPDKEVAFLLPGIIIALVLLTAGLFIVFERNIQRPVEAMISNVNKGHDISATGITEFDQIGHAVNAAFGRERDQTEELEIELGERMRMEGLLKESENQITLILDSMAEGIYGVDLNGTCTFCNPAALRYFGYERPEDVLGKNIHELIHHTRPDGTPYPAEECKVYLSFRTGDGRHVDDEVFWRSDKTSFPIEYWTQPIMRNGAPVGAVTAFVDISERKLAEQALERANTEWSTAIDASNDIIYILDVDRRLIRANKMFYQMTRSEPNSAVGRHIADIVHPDGEKVLCPVCRAQEEKRDVILTMESDQPYNPAGRPIEVVVKIVRDKLDNPVSIFMSLHDLTHERQMRQNQIKLEDQLRQSQKMESIGTLAGGVAHDFNNILSAISGYGHLTLMKMKPDDPHRSNLRQILEASDRAAHLTRDLLLFSRKQPTNRKSIDLNEVVQKLSKFLVRVIGEDITFKTMLSGGAMPVLADSHQIEQVLMNLATNARDAMPKGGTFTIATEQIWLNDEFTSAHGFGTPGPYVLLSVTDTGSGMDKKTQHRIFEPFFTTKEVGKGTGLGLSVVFGIVQQHDGLVDVASEPGHGTTFRIYLPVHETTAAEETAPAAEEPPVGGTETILLAEDDKTVREMTQIMLQDFNYTVVTAVDGFDAVKRFQENKDRFQLLLLDLIMPNKTGKDAYDEIKQLRPDIKVIFASGYDPDQVRQKALLEQNVPVIYKPFSLTTLLKMIRDVLDNGKA